jgi:hypothetical protein
VLPIPGVLVAGVRNNASRGAVAAISNQDDAKFLPTQEDDAKFLPTQDSAWPCAAVVGPGVTRNDDRHQSMVRR